MSDLVKKWLNLTTPIQILKKEEALASTFGGLREAAKANNDPTKQEDLLYVTFILCHEGNNANGDYFFREELENAYLSASQKAYNMEHGLPIIGTITDAELIKPGEDEDDQRWRIECAAVVWKYRFPEEAEAIAEGGPEGTLRNSMECYFRDFAYVLGDASNVVDKEDHPELADYVGGELNGVPVYRGLKQIFFSGAGVVERPADKDAVYLSVAKLQDGDETAAKEDASVKNTDEPTEAQATEDVIADEAIVEDEVVDAGEAETEATETDEQDDSEAGDKSEAEVEATSENEAPAQDNPDSVAETEQPTEAAMTFDEIFEGRLDRDRFYIIFSALEESIYEVLWDDEIEDKQAQIGSQVQAFADKLFEVLPRILGSYAASEAQEDEATAASKQELDQAKSEIESLQSQLSALQIEFDAYKQAVEAEKEEATVNALAAQRVADLVKSGIVISEWRVPFVSDKVKNMSEADYLEYKDFLIEIRYNTASANPEDVSSDEDATASKDGTPLPPGVLAHLNIERTSEDLTDKYRRLAGRIVR